MNWRTIPKTDPKRLTKLVQEAQGLDRERAMHEKQANALKAEVKLIKDTVLEEFNASDLTAVTTKYGTAKRSVTDLPQIDSDNGGWDKFYPHLILPGVEAAFPRSPGTAALAKKIAKAAQWDLLEKRLGRVACRSRWDAGAQIPGVKVFTLVDLKLSEE